MAVEIGGTSRLNELKPRPQRPPRDVCSLQHVLLERHQFGRESGELLELPLGISVFDHNRAALDVTEVTQPLTEGLGRVGISGQADRQVAYSRILAAC